MASELKKSSPPTWDSSASALALAAIAATLASTCCVMPLVLAIIGISGSWISQLRWLQPYSNALMALAMGSLGLAAWRLFRPATGNERACGTADAACHSVNATARRWFWLVVVLTLIPMLVPLAAPLFY